MSYQQEAVREWARAEGQGRPDSEWLLSNYDTWEHNPYYTGKPGKHPEDDQDCYEEAPVYIDVAEQDEPECPF